MEEQRCFRSLRSEVALTVERDMIIFYLNQFWCKHNKQNRITNHMHNTYGELPFAKSLSFSIMGRLCLVGEQQMGSERRETVAAVGDTMTRSTQYRKSIRQVVTIKSVSVNVSVVTTTNSHTHTKRRWYWSQS